MLVSNQSFEFSIYPWYKAVVLKIFLAAAPLSPRLSVLRNISLLVLQLLPNALKEGVLPTLGTTEIKGYTFLKPLKITENPKTWSDRKNKTAHMNACPGQMLRHNQIIRQMKV